MDRLNELLPKLDAFREEAATRLAEIDAVYGPGSPGILHAYFSRYSAAILAFRNSTTKAPAWINAGMVTSKDVLPS